MTFPPGEWSPSIVGDQWPRDDDMVAIQHGKTNREAIETGFNGYADMLSRARTGPLAGQQGHTADDLRNAFQRGEEDARLVALKNGVKQSAYGTACDSTQGLRQDLTGLAEEGNKQIKEIQNSKEPAEAKVTQIVAAIQQYRALSNLAAAKYCGNVLDATQRVLDADGSGQSARQFARAHGLDLGQMFRQPDQPAELKNQVERMLGSPSSTQSLLSDGKLPPVSQGAHAGGPPETGRGTPEVSNLGQLPNVGQPGTGDAPGPKPTSGLQQASLRRGQLPNVGSARTFPVPPSSEAPLPINSAPMPAPGMSGGPAGPSGLAGAPSGPLPGAPPSLAAPPIAPPSPAQGLTPSELMHSFDKGMQAGAPFSAAAEAVPPPAAMTATEPQATPTSQSASLSARVHAPVFDSPPPATHTAAPDALTPPAVVAGPAASASSVAATAPPSGPLPAYASDLRPTITAATTPAAPPSPPPSTTPASASVHPSAGQGNASQPTVVRRVNPPLPPSSASSLGTQAVAATATGAVVGAASADATARARLQRLVSAVARQQPRLAWAAGDRPDNTTVLATDLASGWIPPGIEIPAVVTLLPPERRRGDLESLLGEVGIAAAYAPIHHVPEDNEPIPMSPRPRRVADIDELGWELGQATQWRDGLPRLAHTLAKAASAGTGVLDSEVERLHEHLAAISARVLDGYPNEVDSRDVGNWQLLAAIDALVAGDKSGATYHLAWFQACGATVAHPQH